MMFLPGEQEMKVLILISVTFLGLLGWLFIKASS